MVLQQMRKQQGRLFATQSIEQGLGEGLALERQHHQRQSRVRLDIETRQRCLLGGTPHRGPPGHGLPVAFRDTGEVLHGFQHLAARGNSAGPKVMR